MSFVTSSEIIASWLQRVRCEHEYGSFLEQGDKKLSTKYQAISVVDITIGLLYHPVKVVPNGSGSTKPTKTKRSLTGSELYGPNPHSLSHLGTLMVLIAENKAMILRLRRSGEKCKQKTLLNYKIKYNFHWSRKLSSVVLRPVGSCSECLQAVSHVYFFDLSRTV